MKTRYISVLALTVMLSACDLAPDFHLPIISKALKFREAPAEAVVAEAPPPQTLTLASPIEYKSKDKWAIVLNGQKVISECGLECMPSPVRGFKVEKNKVTLKWFDKDKNKATSLTLKPGQTIDLATGKAPKPVKLAKAAAQEVGTWKVAEPSSELPRGEWWRVFKDDKLNALVEEAVTGNEDVKAMIARVKQSRASAKIARSYLFPDGDNTSSFIRRQPNAVGRGLAPGSSLAIENDVKTDFGLNYELDVIGRNHTGWLAARLDAKAAGASLQSVKLTLQADVADLYFSIRAADRDIDILQRGIALRQGNAGILKKKMSAGDITELDVAASVVDLENTRQQLQAAELRRETLDHALAVALGRAPADFTLQKGWVVSAIPVIPAGLPSSLLERRPDVVAAQKTLEASNERIGLARAAFFPSLFLTGTGGFESDTLGNLFQWASRSWSIGPMISIPLFGGGRAIGNLANSKAKYEESVAQYRGQVLKAFQDVEDSLSTLKSLQKQAQAQYAAEHASKRAAEIAKLRYDEGDLGYLETITARREALESERSGVEIKRARLSATVRLIRALGGGWDAPQVPVIAKTEVKKNG